MKGLWIIMAFISGAMLPVQAGLNARMGKSIESSVYAALISFVVGAVGLSLYILLTKQQVSWSGLSRVPGYVWVAGLLGAFYVTAIVILFPQLGPALTFGLVVAGQMVIAVVLDHLNILTANPHPFNWWRLLGILMIIGGVIIVRKF